MTEARISPVRRWLMWWFGRPANPYVTVSFSVDVAPTLQWLDTLSAPRPTLHHVLMAAVGRTLREFPAANARVLGRRIVRFDHVGVVMPVNLLGHAGEARREVSLTIVDHVDRLSVRAIAEATREAVKGERTGAPQLGLVQQLLKVVENAPPRVIDATFSAIDFASRRDPVARQLHAWMPLTTAISNAGAAFRKGDGMWFRGADIAVPTRLVDLGTFWGVSAIQDEVVAVDGVPVVRPILPLVFLFDHRLIDGVMAARLLTRFGEHLRDPSTSFGADADRAA